MVAVIDNHELAEAMARLDRLTDWERRPRRTMRVGLAPMQDLSARLGDPHRAFRSVHVAGTKGKGSVSALIEAGLVRAGLIAGRYGSPHVERVTERVGLEHTEILGETRAAIVREKVGILKPGAVLVTTLDPDDEARRVLQARADELGCAVVRAAYQPDSTIEETNVALAGTVLDQLGQRGVSARSGEPVAARLIDARTRAAARLIGRMERHDVEV